ncbi:cuticle protein 4.9 [Drosophila simulans]|uniref:Uncharacterized protein n=2 Tax=melanogaster subgroup TaxID=32351 RepID=A0A0J9RWD4_DROSI|nr:cuticle protein 4.9 [Drosophila simulans]XP_033160239.1 cuticle protein 4.9 [Drosophila mauritiana]KMY99981.1 uncharacterized protein Dsimw501_GD29010 [Drosophila simulans]
MFKFVAAVIFALFACVAAKPGIVAPLAYSAPYVASPYVASPYVASPYVASPYVAAPYTAAYTAAYAAPYTAAYTAPYAAYTSPLLLKK